MIFSQADRLSIRTSNAHGGRCAGSGGSFEVGVWHPGWIRLAPKPENLIEQSTGFNQLGLKRVRWDWHNYIFTASKREEIREVSRGVSWKGHDLLTFLRGEIFFWGINISQFVGSVWCEDLWIRPDMFFNFGLTFGPCGPMNSPDLHQFAHHFGIELFPAKKIDEIGWFSQEQMCLTQLCDTNR